MLEKVKVSKISSVLEIMKQLDVAYLTNTVNSNGSSKKVLFVPSRLTDSKLDIESCFPPQNRFADKNGKSHLFLCVRFCGNGEGNTILPSFIGRIAYMLSNHHHHHHDDNNKDRKSNRFVSNMKMCRGCLYMKLPSQTECRIEQQWNTIDVLMICRDKSQAISDVLFLLRSVYDLLSGIEVWEKINFDVHQLCGGCMGKENHDGSMRGN